MLRTLAFMKFKMNRNFEAQLQAQLAPTTAELESRLSEVLEGAAGKSVDEVTAELVAAARTVPGIEPDEAALRQLAEEQVSGQDT